MNADKKDPVLVIVSVMTVLLLGGFILAVYVGMSGRKTEAARRYLSFRGGSPAVPGYFEGIKRGAAEIQKKAVIWAGSFFAGTTAPSDLASATQRDTDRNRIADDDTYEKDFNENYDGGYASGKRSGLRSSWADTDGGEFSSGGPTGSGGYESAPEGRSYRVRKAAAGGTASSGAGGPASTPHSIPGGTASDANRAASPQSHASLPPKNSRGSAGGNSGGFSPEYGGEKFKKGGGLQGMNGNGPGAALNGASESMKTEAQNSYKPGASGGAAAAAAAGAAGTSGAAAPKVPAPEKAAADAKTAKGAAGPDSDSEDGMDDELYADSSGAEDQNLISSVITARLKGTDVMKYIPEEKAAGEPEEALLQAGAADTTADNQSPSKTDPTNLDMLSEERKKEMREDIHVFLKKVENKYGEMTDIYDTPCRSTPILCKEHGISGNYLTMLTAKGAKLVLGTKYLNGRWRRYTIDFKKPPSPRP